MRNKESKKRDTNWYLFPNGKIWRVNHFGHVDGTVSIPNYEEIEGLEEKLSAISTAVTGSVAGLVDFAYRYIGNDMMEFSGNVAEMLREQDEEAPGVVVVTDLDVIGNALQAQYGLSDIEMGHTLFAIDAQYGKESILEIAGSNRRIHCPAYPESCSYVRIVVDGLEVAYWVEDEWKDAPAEVMGAILGAAKGVPSE
jgi:hypothetical protein